MRGVIAFTFSIILTGMLIFLIPLVRCQMGVLDPYCLLNKSKYQVQIHIIHFSIYYAFSRGVPMNLNLFKS